MKKLYIIVALTCVTLCPILNSGAQVIEAKKGITYQLSFPMVSKADWTAFIAGETVSATSYYKDDSGAWTGLTLADSITEIGTTGVYEITLSATEMSHDYLWIKFTSTNAADTAYVIRTDQRVDHTYILTSTINGDPIVGAAVWATTDSAGTNIIDAGITDSNGNVTLQLEPGTYYFWRGKSRTTFSDPDTEAVTE